MDPQIIQIQKDITDLKSQMGRHQHETIDGTASLNKTAFVTFSLPDTQSQTATNYGICFIATRPCSIKSVSEVHTVLGSSTPTLQIEKLTGTTAPGSGTPILLTAFDLHATANIVQRGVLVSTKQTTSGLLLSDRLALKVSGTLTALKGVTVTIELAFT